MNHKAAETTYSINAFGLGTVSKSIVQWWFKKFCKGDTSLENEELSGWPSEVDNWEDHWSWFCLKTMILLKLYEKSLRNSTLTILWSFGIWSKWQRWKGLISGCLRSWLKKKIVFVKCHLLLQQQTISQSIVTCGKKWWPAKWLDQEEAPKHFQSQTCTKKKVMVPVWWSAACLIHTAFWIPAKPLHLRSMLSRKHWELQGLQLALVNRKDHNNAWPNIAQPTLQKLNELSYKVLLHLPYSPKILPTDYHFFKHLDNFLQGKCFHNQQEAKNAFQEFIESQSIDFYTTGISKLISHWQKYVDCIGSYFD